MGADIVAIAKAELETVRAKIAALESEASDIEAFLRVAARFAATEPQGGLVHTAPAASEGAHNPTSDAPHSAQAEAPEAGVSEHPEAHSMATGGEKDAGTSASGHENALDPVPVPVEGGPVAGADSHPQHGRATNTENADGPSAGGRAEIDAYPAAPNPEAKASTGNAVSTTASAVSVPQAREASEADGSGDVSRPSDGGGPVAPISETTGPRPSAGEATASPAPKPVGSLASRIRAYMADHPGATCGDCAEALGESYDRVWQNGRRIVDFAKRRRGRKPRPPQIDAEPPKPVEAPAPAPTLVRQPAAKPEQRRPGSTIVRRDPVVPKGRLFWLKNDDGEYLNRFCLGFTRDRREAWSGNQDQLAACRRVYPLAIDLREQPVEKEQRRVA